MNAHPRPALTRAEVERLEARDRALGVPAVHVLPRSGRAGTLEAIAWLSRQRARKARP